MDFSSLPDDCVSEILSLTSPHDVGQMSTISWEIRTIVDSNIVWERFLPSYYHQIVSRSVSPVSFSTKKELFLRLSDTPLLLDQGHLSFVLDRKTGKICYMLGARLLEITWSGTPIHCEWISTPLSRFPEVCDLMAPFGFEIRGKLESRLLSPNTTYVAYLIFIFGPGLNFIPAISVRVAGKNSGNGPKDKGETVSLQTDPPRKMTSGWREIQMGEFFNSGQGEDVVEMTLTTIKAHPGCHLAVKGIELRPKVG
ncbi:hypothetical protein NMG60_11017646 [Bertholletia excelsa]